METERPWKNQRRLSDWLINRQSESVEACFKRFFPIERSRGLSAVSVFSSDSVKKSPSKLCLLFTGYLVLST